MKNNIKAMKNGQTVKQVDLSVSGKGMITIDVAMWSSAANWKNSR